MIELLQHLFGWICGQNPEHTWAFGGWLLPCCQRCTGLYVGAVIAALLHGWLKPKLTGPFLEVHGSFLLLMIPFGYHWLPQEAWLRTVTGLLFGFGLVTYLSLIPAGRWRDEDLPARPGAPWVYGAAVGLALVLVPATTAWGGPVAAWLLSGLAFCGAGILLGLVLVNLGCSAAALWRSHV